MVSLVRYLVTSLVSMNLNSQTFALLLVSLYLALGLLTHVWIVYGLKRERNPEQVFLTVLRWPIYAPIFVEHLYIVLIDRPRLMLRRRKSVRDLRLLQKNADKVVANYLKSALTTVKVGMCPKCNNLIRCKNFTRLKCKKCKKAKYRPVAEVWDGENLADLDLPKDFLDQMRERVFGKDYMERNKQLNKELGIEE